MEKVLCGKQIALWAYGIEFKHPVKDEMMKFEALPEKNEAFDRLIKKVHTI